MTFGASSKPKQPISPKRAGLGEINSSVQLGDSRGNFHTFTYMIRPKCRKKNQKRLLHETFEISMKKCAGKKIMRTSWLIPPSLERIGKPLEPKIRLLMPIDFFFSISAMSPITMLTRAYSIRERKTKTVQPDMKTSSEKHRKHS